MIPKELYNLYQKGRVIPFIGAGISRSVVWTTGDGQCQKGISWEEFVDQAAKILDFDPTLLRMRGTDLQILEYYSIRKNGNWDELKNWFHEVMKPDDESLKDSGIHKALANLEKSKIFYTTNFDNFLERSFMLNNRKIHVVVEESHINFDANQSEIIKFHGDLNHSSEMVISEKDYERRISLSGMLDSRFKSDLLNRVVLFLGYSFRDPNVAYLLRLFNEEHGENLRDFRSAKRAYIVVHHPSEFEHTLFEDRNIGVLPVEDTNLTDGYVKLLRELVE